MRDCPKVTFLLSLSKVHYYAEEDEKTLRKNEFFSVKLILSQWFSVSCS